MDTLRVLDTDVCIDHFRGLAAATAYILTLPVADRATTDITVMELYRGWRIGSSSRRLGSSWSAIT